MGKVKTESTMRTLVVADTTGGVKLNIPVKLRQLVVIPNDLTKLLSIKFKTTDPYMQLPQGTAYGSGYVDSIITDNVYVLMSDNSGVKVEYWV